jgi:quinol monooxygenase YgiN
MHIQIVNFKLRGIDEQQYAKVCDDLAPTFGAVPGLLAKVWLANREAGIYGGVYTFEDRAAMDRYQQSDLFKAVGAHPNLADITVTDFEVMESPTRVTRGLATALA